MPDLSADKGKGDVDMKLYLANPIYDAVFKYLMEDERIARTLISALLKKMVLQLQQLLRVFDQTNVIGDSQQTIEVDYDAYAVDTEMEYIVKRLLSAASNPDVRQEMNVEDEFFTANEDRDTAIMARDKTIDEQGKALQ